MYSDQNNGSFGVINRLLLYIRAASAPSSTGGIMLRACRPPPCVVCASCVNLYRQLSCPETVSTWTAVSCMVLLLSSTAVPLQDYRVRKVAPGMICRMSHLTGTRAASFFVTAASLCPLFGRLPFATLGYAQQPRHWVRARVATLLGARSSRDNSCYTASSAGPLCLLSAVCDLL